MGKVLAKNSWIIFKKLFLPVLLFCLFAGGYVIYRLQFASFLSAQLQQQIHKFFIAVFVVIISFLAQRILNALLNIYSRSISSGAEIKTFHELTPLFRRIASVLIWVIAFLIILPLFGVNISALIATLGVGSLAIALAAKDTIANIIAGFMIMVDRPFRIGDNIKLPSGEDVSVLDIGIRRSTFSSADKKTVISMPNVDLSKNKIVNYTYAEGKA